MKKIVCCLLCLLLCACSANTSKYPEKEPEQPPVTQTRADLNVTFLAVGDNLLHGAVYTDPYCRKADGTWDYSGIYAHTKDMIQSADVANINQETILGGRELGLESYPSFNSPQEFADALYGTGFDWVSQATNHCLDMGEAGIVADLTKFDRYESMIVTGINRSQEEREQPRVIEKSGMKIGLLNYTYGTNGYTVPQGKDYLVNYIDKNAIAKDIERLKSEKVDTIIASMHWGVEYNMGVTEEQKELAQYLADAGVSVIIGAHPHVIEPAEYITSKDGKKTLVYYSLGNFVSAQDRSDTMLGGMATFTLHLDGKTGEVSSKDAKFYPTITHFDKRLTHFETYLLKDYTQELAAAHYYSSNLSRQYFIDLTENVMKHAEGIDIIY